MNKIQLEISEDYVEDSEGNDEIKKKLLELGFHEDENGDMYKLFDYYWPMKKGELVEIGGVWRVSSIWNNFEEEFVQYSLQPA